MILLQRSILGRKETATSIRLILSALVLFSAGCATTYSDQVSYLYGNRIFRANIHTFPAVITAVDGRSTMIGESPVRVEPGEHVISLVTAPAAGFRVAEHREIRLVVEPCKRYYIVAERENALLQAWKPVLDYVEDTGGKGCRSSGSRPA